jgi:two-component system OmpR family response regulator
LHPEHNEDMRALLIVEDDTEMAAALESGLRAEGYDTVAVGDGVNALTQVATREFAACVVDLNLPGMSGFEICRRIRESGNTVPLLMLTARASLDDRVSGLDSGADDYLTKPFSLAELAARLRALLRRNPHELWIRDEFGDITMDSRARRVTVAGHGVALSPKEFELLRTLIGRPETPWSQAELLSEVWGSENISPNVVQQYISALRRKLAAFDSRVEITTKRNAGYQVRVRP